MIRSYTAQIVLAGTAAGTAMFGAVIDSSGTPVNGRLFAIQFNCPSQPTSLNVQIATIGQGLVAETLLNYTGGTSQWFYPRAQAHNTSGGALGATVVSEMPVDDQVSMVASAGSAGTVTAKLLLWQ